MPRRLRAAAGGYVYHVLNRAVGRARLFDKSAVWGLRTVLRQAQDWQPMRLLAYCAMPNHWHLVLWPREHGALSEFMHWLTATHTPYVVHQESSEAGSPARLSEVRAWHPFSISLYFSLLSRH